MPTYASGADLAATTDAGGAWADVNTAVANQVGQIRAAQKVFGGNPNPGGQPVPADKLELATMTIVEGLTKPLIEISVEFTLTQNQVANDDTLNTACTLASIAAKFVAQMEDMIIFNGKATIPKGMENVVKINRQDPGAQGLLDLAPPLTHPPTDVFDHPEKIFKAVVDGISQLNESGQPGPYALFLEPSIFAAAYSPVNGTTTADMIAPLVPGGFYSTSTLKAANKSKPGDFELYGLLVSTGGDPTTLYVDTDAVAVFTMQDAEGRSKFRVYERIQYVARDSSAFVKIHFK